MYINTEGTQPYELTQLIAIYEDTYNGGQYIEHGFVDTENNVTWKPISKSKFYQDIKKQILERIAGNKITGKITFLPQDVLHFNHEYKNIIFYIPPGKRLLYFNFLEKPINIPLPGLLFTAFNNSIDVYAFKRKGIPTKNTIYYNCPLPNSGCMGNVKINLDYNLEPAMIRDQILCLYFDSKFTSENMYNAIRDYDGSDNNAAISFYDMISKMDKFPNRLLKRGRKEFLR